MPDSEPDACRCGHGRSSHSEAFGKCRRWISGGLDKNTYCTCNAFNDEGPLITAARSESMHELLEHVATLDRRYSRMPIPPWGVRHGS